LQSQSTTSKDDYISDTNREKRKWQELMDSSLVSSEPSTQSPTHKKGNHDTCLINNNDNSSTSSMTYSQATSSKSTLDSDEAQHKSINDNMTQLTILNPTNNKGGNENKPIQPVAESIIPFIDTSTVDIMTSTMTTDDHGVTTLIQSNLITKIVNQQICKITSAMTTKYKNEIKNNSIITLQPNLSTY
jgi:hypothetical protein